MASSGNVSVVRQNYHAESEAALNRQINMELYSSYTYMSMASYFDRDDVALPGFAKYFKKRSDEDKEDAEKLTKYQNMRGGRIVFADVKKPERDEWGNGLDAISAALLLEKKVNATLLEMHEIGNKHGDVQMCDYIEEEFLEDEAKLLKELGDYISNLKRVGPGLGEYQFDKHLSS